LLRFAAVVPEAAFEQLRVADIERPDGWAPIRQALGVRSFGINAWTGHEAGATLIPPHDEAPTQHEELYLVTAGRATFTVDGQTLDAPAGTIVYVRDPAATRAAVAGEPETTVVSIGAPPGRAFAPGSWEVGRDLLALFDAGRHGDAKRLLTQALDRYADRGYLLYNLACAEARLGELDAAFEHLAAAVDEFPALAAEARGDADLAALRADPRFDQLAPAG
jgi:tetratricopeptide (TPR) repeat protein